MGGTKIRTVNGGAGRNLFGRVANLMAEAGKPVFHLRFALNSPAALNQHQVLKLAHLYSFDLMDNHNLSFKRRQKMAILTGCLFLYSSIFILLARLRDWHNFDSSHLATSCLEYLTPCGRSNASGVEKFEIQLAALHP